MDRANRRYVGTGRDIVSEQKIIKKSRPSKDKHKNYTRTECRPRRRYNDICMADLWKMIFVCRYTPCHMS